MNHKLIYSRSILINSKLNSLDYYITVNTTSIIAEDTCLYGIKVEKNKCESYDLPNYFDTYHHASVILTTLAKYKVTPIVCGDVIDDLLKK